MFSGPGFSCQQPLDKPCVLIPKAGLARQQLSHPSSLPSGNKEQSKHRLPGTRGSCLPCAGPSGQVGHGTRSWQGMSRAGEKGRNHHPSCTGKGLWWGHDWGQLPGIPTGTSSSVCSSGTCALRGRKGQEMWPHLLGLPRPTRGSLI